MSRAEVPGGSGWFSTQRGEKQEFDSAAGITGSSSENRALPAEGQPATCSSAPANWRKSQSMSAISFCLFVLSFLFTFFLLIIYIVVYFDLFPHTLSWNLSICRCWQDIFLYFRLCLYKTMSCVMLRSKPTTECPTTNRLPSSCRRSCRTAVHRWKRKRTQSKLSRKNCESLRFV